MNRTATLDATCYQEADWKLEAVSYCLLYGGLSPVHICTLLQVIILPSQLLSGDGFDQHQRFACARSSRYIIILCILCNIFCCHLSRNGGGPSAE